MKTTTNNNLLTLSHSSTLLIFLPFFVLFLGSCNYSKALLYNYPDAEKDPKRFKRADISTEQDVFQFHQYDGAIDYGEKIIIDDWTFNDAASRTLDELAEQHRTSAMIVIRNDTILYENYFRHFTEESYHTSFSVAKSFVSALVGIAIQEGYIENMEQSIVEFMPELLHREGFEDIKLRHLLNHTSGFKLNLTMDGGYLYYGSNVWDSVHKLTLKHKPGTKQHYGNINIQLMAIILERATGKCVSEYLEEKVWTKIGTEAPAFWSVDRNDFEKAYCCLNARARDFARFGRLFLNNGDWEGEQVIDADWIKSSTARDTTEGSGWSYHNSWYKGSDLYQDYMAIGLYQQYIYICPIKNIVIVRFGTRERTLHESRVGWPGVFRDIVDQL